ncbi:MAG: hypothetical protein JWM11_6393, partial [Planctomycetaceae bacterium]|nr:hypothetical protein [Planctomycetaceae bacterium]
VDYGDGTGTHPLMLSGFSFSLNHTYLESGQYSAVVTIVDEIGASDVVHCNVSVQNIAPSVQAGNDQVTDEGTSIKLTGSFIDPGLLDTHTATIDWGDGTPAQPVAVTEANGAGTVIASHAYANENVYTATLTVTDDESASASDSFTVTVRNVAPRVEAGTDRTIQIGDALVLPSQLTMQSFNASIGPFTLQTVAGSFIDAGALDTHTATIDWGDGTVEAVPVNERGFTPQGAPPAQTGVVIGSHLYATRGNFRVLITVTDNHGGVGSDSLVATVNSGQNNAPPTAINDTASTSQNAPAVISVLANDSDSDGTVDITSVSIVAPATHGTTSVNSTTGVVTYTPAPGYTGPDSFTYQFQDNQGATSNVATVSLTVEHNALTIISNATASVPENVPVSSVILDVNATEAGSPTPVLSYALSGPDAALMKINANGEISFISSPDFESPRDQGGDNVYHVTVTVTDNGTIPQSASQDLAITVTNAAEPPVLSLNGPKVISYKKQPPLTVLPQITVTPGDASLGGGQIVIQVNEIRTKRKALDQYVLSPLTSLGSTSGPSSANGHLTLQVHLNQTTTAAHIQTALHEITFSTKGKGRRITTRSMDVTLTASNGLSDQVTQTIDVRKKRFISH